MSSKSLKTPIKDVWEISSIPFSDQRGQFVNIFRNQEQTYREVWGNRSIAQVNLSCTKTIGSVRGLHFQKIPYSEAKLVKCIRGLVWDVVVDLRRKSSSYLEWWGVELSAKRGNALVIPEGCAHGFQVLEANSEVLYLHSGKWVPNAESGIRWNDPTIAIKWPVPVSVVSERDNLLPLLKDLP